MKSLIDVHRWILHSLKEPNQVLQNYTLFANSPHLSNVTKRRLACHMEKFPTKMTFLYYLLMTVNIINEYNKILVQPVKISFVNNKIMNSPESARKKELTREYTVILGMTGFLDSVDASSLKESDALEMKSVTDLISISNDCVKCGNTCIENDSVLTCTNCGLLNNLVNTDSCYKDTDRINTTIFYVHDRKANFRTCLDNYQGKQTHQIPNELYTAVQKKMDIHGLLIPSTDKIVMYSKVTKRHIMIFLKECGFNKFYDSIPYIYNYFTGIPKNDLSKIEMSLIDDLDKLLKHCDRIYDIKHLSNMNMSIILYQFLKRYGVECNMEDFSFPKSMYINDSPSTKYRYDTVLPTVFMSLGWTYYALPLH